MGPTWAGSAVSLIAPATAHSAMKCGTRSTHPASEPASLQATPPRQCDTTGCFSASMWMLCLQRGLWEVVLKADPKVG